MRRLIINADDFGMTPGVNRAIDEAHAAGLVTSATIMANEPATQEAVQLASRHPGLGTGCHVVLVDGVPVSEPNAVPSLIASDDHNAKFRPGVAQLALAATGGKVREQDVYAEACSQIGKLLSAGARLSHVDCHMHSHMLPVVTRGVLKAAREHGVLAVRNPFEPFWSVKATHKLTSVRSWSRSLQVTVLRGLHSEFLSIAQENGIRTTEGCIGVAVTGLLDRDLLGRLLDAMPDGTWELVTHPGYRDEALEQSTTELKQSREIERELFTSAETLALIRRRNIQLISFREL